MNIDKSKALFERAVKVTPGGVNSPVRAFSPVGGQPRLLHVQKAHIFTMRMEINTPIISVHGVQ